MQEQPIKTLQKLKSSKVVVRLKSNIEYRGRLANTDPLMNIILEDAREFILNSNDEFVLTKGLGKVFVRGNNILFIKFE